MAEVQTSTEAGEMAQRFVEMVMMQAQNAAFALGQIPHPETGEAPVNLDLAKLFIDQLVMLRSKTRGNLTGEELGVLNNAISNLQMVFVEVSQHGASSGGDGFEEEPESIEPPAAAAPGEAQETAPAPDNAEPAPPAAEETRKKFSKSYGS
ncbi:MAG TPA: DUF1844 domain-containing protein [Chthoniobacteraceae bacterium]|jgi:hypothetical protein|nr:DUF1844 domain-containing protein [Chthoniobacteraceae bacterium]